MHSIFDEIDPSSGLKTDSGLQTDVLFVFGELTGMYSTTKVSKVEQEQKLIVIYWYFAVFCVEEIFGNYFLVFFTW